MPHFVCVCACVCVGEIISIPWFSKELKNNLSKNNCLRGVILILLLRESIFVGWGSPFPIVLVPRYKLSLCHTPIKPDYLAFRELVSLRVGCVTMWSWGSHQTRYGSTNSLTWKTSSRTLVSSFLLDRFLWSACFNSQVHECAM